MSTNASTLSTALAEHQAGRLAQAEAIYREHLAQSPADLAALIGLADVLTDAGQISKAEEFYRKAIAVDGDSPAATGAYDGLAAVLQAQGDLDNAVIAGKKAAMLRGAAQETFEIGETLEKLGRTRDAMEMFLLATRQQPAVPAAHVKAAHYLAAAGRYGEAIPHYLGAIAAFPLAAEHLCNLAIAQRSLGEFATALATIQRACKMNPTLPDGFNIKGAICNDLGRTDEAVAAFERAIAIKPDYADAINNMGSTLHQAGRVKEAAPLFARAVEREPYSIQFHQNLGSNALLRGDFETGWKEFEWRRYKTNNPGSRPFTQPVWDGAPLAGKTIMLFAEQGLGDTIQFLRYVPMVTRAGGRVLVECQPELMSLIEKMPGVANVISQKTPWPACDVQCALMSLPMVFKTRVESIPNSVPYIHADAAKAAAWATRLQAFAGKRVGLAWAGSPTHENDAKRSLPTGVFVPLAEIPRITFVSLQKQQREAPPAALKIQDFTWDLTDFADTAALITGLDLVISADTAVAHLAGAMGKPVWTLLPFSPDWRWMTERDDSPWYPTMRLFRQTVPGDWGGVIARVCEALRK